MKLISHHVSAKSRFHVKNEDSFFVCDDYVIVADGMGGESSGDIASKIAVDSIADSLKTIDIEGLNSKTAKESIFNAISKADMEISNYIDSHPESMGMGTTILVAVFGKDSVFISWCGDSHCFIYDNGRLGSLTKDHSYVQELIDKNMITVEESFTHSDNNIITRYVGGGEEYCKPEFISQKKEQDDLYIFCSDGLSGYCRLEDIRNCIYSNKRISDIPDKLLNLALNRGSDDDITIVASAVKNEKNSIFGWLKC